MIYAPDQAIIATPVGYFLLWGDSDTLHGARIDPSQGRDEVMPQGDALKAAVAQLRRYFSGDLKSFNLPLTANRTSRGAALRAGIIAVPYGTTATYGEVARRSDSGPRAVGQACRTNPFPVIVPCHRIVSASGPEHYSGADGILTKQWLIEHEHHHMTTLL